MGDNRIEEPVIHEIEDNQTGIDALPDDLEGMGRKKEVLLDYPTVYIHNWKVDDQYEVYIGESNDVIRRTREHHEAALKGDGWQVQLEPNHASLFIIGHAHFNKSLTMDLENKLMHYMLGAHSVSVIHNKRENPQYQYYTSDERDEIFQKIWVELGKRNPELFLKECLVTDSAIFKASPLHDLTKDQRAVKDLVLQRVSDAMDSKEKGQLIFVSGEAGTGKTVLTSCLFYELSFLKSGSSKKEISCHLVVNHDEQLTVYQQIAGKLNIGNGQEVVSKPTHFINSHSTAAPVDVVLVDEAHLLLTRGKQAYKGKNQLDDIRQLAKVVVVMFDKCQILRAEQYWENKVIEKLEEEAIAYHNYAKLEKQLRITGSDETVAWINHFTRDNEITKIPRDDKYDIKILDTPEALEAAIKEKAGKPETMLSRMIATYDWDYNKKSAPKNPKMDKWEVAIGTWRKPWNLQLKFSRAEKKANKGLSWAEQPQTLDEIGSTFTIQGFDLSYAGVILGPSVKYRNGKIVFDPDSSKNKNATTFRKLSDGTKRKFGELLIGNEVNVLMTRGVQGLYIFACDEELRQALKDARS